MRSRLARLAPLGQWDPRGRSPERWSPGRRGAVAAAGAPGLVPELRRRSAA